MLEAQAAWQITDILSGVRPPDGAAQRGIAYKTGTSYGYRDAWSVGFDGRYVLGVWVGRAGFRCGARPVRLCLGRAHPVRGLSPAPALPPRRSAARRPAHSGSAHGDLPVTLERFVSAQGDAALATAAVTEPAPQIVFPPDGARVELGAPTPTRRRWC